VCNKCLLNVARILPLVPGERQWSLLISATAFPLASCEHTESQLQELAALTDGTYEGCVAFAEHEVDRIMASFDAVDYS
jgi:hypothetical protein